MDLFEEIKKALEEAVAYEKGTIDARTTTISKDTIDGRTTTISKGTIDARTTTISKNP